MARNRERGWRDKFREAFHGLKLGMRGQSSFAVHFFFAAMVVMVATVMQCDWLEWCLLAACIGGVLTVELLNSSLETLFHGLDIETKNRLKGVLDISAGAVLIASMTAVVIGSIIFLRRLALDLAP